MTTETEALAEPELEVVSELPEAPEPEAPEPDLPEAPEPELPPEVPHVVYWTHGGKKTRIAEHPSKTHAIDHAAELVKTQRAAIADLCRRNGTPVPKNTDYGDFSVEAAPVPVVVTEDAPLEDASLDDAPLEDTTSSDDAAPPEPVSLDD